MTVQTEYQQAYNKRLAAIEADPRLTVLSSMNQRQDAAQKKVSQYIVFTDFKFDEQKQKTNSIYVYTPFENVDKYGHSKADYQSQLLFETNRWDNGMHITVLETLGSESRLAFYDFENMGLAQLALKAFINLATKADIAQVDGTISSFDKVNLTKLRHIFTKFGFTIKLTDPQTGIGKISRKMQ